MTGMRPTAYISLASMRLSPCMHAWLDIYWYRLTCWARHACHLPER